MASTDRAVIVWTAETMRLPCPLCHASKGARCRTASGGRATAPHRGRLVPVLVCPACDSVTADPTNVRHGYCPTCHDWTAPGRHGAAQDTLFQDSEPICEECGSDLACEGFCLCTDCLASS